MKLNLPAFIAHRGAPLVAPENTLAAFRAAQEQGATWIECDVQLTRDAVPIIFHDFTLDRTSNGHGRVEKAEWREIQKLDAGSWFGAKFRGEKILTLREVLQFSSENKMAVNLELKCSDERSALLAEIVHEAIKHHDQPILVSSFNYEVLVALRRINLNVALGLNCEEWHLSHISRAKKIEAYSIHVNQRDVNATLMEECRSNFLQVLAFSVNDSARAKTLHKLGVLSLFTDSLF